MMYSSFVDERKFGVPPGDAKNEKPPIMKDGEFYDLTPPSRRTGKTFHRVRCEYRVPNNPNEYVVEGIPEGGDKPESFVLRFTGLGVVRINRSKEQNF